MATATLSYSRIQKNIQSKVASVNFLKVNWKTVCFASLFLCLSILIHYVWQVNHLTKGSYLIVNYEKQINKLSDENKNLEVNFAKNSFLGQVQQKIQALNFQRATSIKYIQILDNSLTAIRK